MLPESVVQQPLRHGAARQLLALLGHAVEAHAPARGRMAGSLISARILGKTMRYAVRNKERRKGRRTPTQDPSTNYPAPCLAGRVRPPHEKPTSLGLSRNRTLATVLKASGFATRPRGVAAAGEQLLTPPRG